jgi:hypothetical protein
MITSLSEPRISPQIIAVIDRLKSRGWNLRWYINTELQGAGSANLDTQEISFKSKELSQNPGVILHELVHVDQFDRGYPRLKSDSSPYGTFMLNDVFEHILMLPEIEKAGFSIGDQEIPATLSLISQLTGAHPPLVEDEELFAAALYVRGHFLGIEDSQLALLREHIQKKNTRITMDQISEAIKNLPESDSAVAVYSTSLQKVVAVLGLESQVTVITK